MRTCLWMFHSISAPLKSNMAALKNMSLPLRNASTLLELLYCRYFNLSHVHYCVSNRLAFRSLRTWGSSSLTWHKTSTYLSCLSPSSFSPAFSASARLACSCGRTTTWGESHNRTVPQHAVSELIAVYWSLDRTRYTNGLFSRGPFLCYANPEQTLECFCSTLRRL